MGARTWAAFAAATIVVGVGCRQIIGIGDPVFNGSAGAGGAGSTSSSRTVATTGTGGAGGAVVSTSTVGSTGTGGSSCAVTHPGGGTCEYLPGQECGCSDPGEKCSVIDPTTGESACVTAGTTADYDACTSTTDCKEGSWCELSTSVCEPICVDTCSDGLCLEAAQGSTGTATIPGLDVCSIKCNLLTGSPCGPNATCVAVLGTGATITECFKSGGVAQGMDCATAPDCAAGLVCVENPITSSTECVPWCTPTGTLCAAGSMECIAFSPSVDVGGTAYGYCGGE